MTANDAELVVGVDGGGSKTIAWVAAKDAALGGAPRGVGQAGPGNPRAVGFETALRNIELAIDSARQAAGWNRQTVHAACLALAGADRPDERQVIERWAAGRQLARRLVITNDAEPLLAAASPAGWGIALIAGTGSFAVGRAPDGQSARCGGWGYLVGDEGSGYALALAGMRCVTRAADGRGPATQLLDRLLADWGISSPAELVPVLYGAEMTRRRIAEFAPVVLETARGGDPVAAQLVVDAAAELAVLVSTLRRRLGLATGTFPLALAGGVLVHAAELREQLGRQLAATGDVPAEVTVVTEPVRGAVALARRLA